MQNNKLHVIQSQFWIISALNEQNGAMIALLSRHNTQSLHILKGKSQSSNTYGPDGSSKADLFKRSLISV
jgi:flagella synthesis protein FlgN